MPGQNQETELQERVFGDDGEEIDAAAEEIEENPAPSAHEEPEEDDEQDEPAASAKKYRIGDQEFSTLAEAQAYASQQVEQGSESDAYRQIVHEMIQSRPGSESVTPPKPAGPKLDTEKLWADPETFLSEFASDVKKQAIQEVSETLHQKRVKDAQDDALFQEFSTRHPDLADFREEVEQTVGQHLAAVRTLTQKKGRGAAYDYIAMHLREKFQKYAEAGKPRRVLANGRGGAAPVNRGSGVTPKPKPKKVLSMADQVRSIKRVKR